MRRSVPIFLLSLGIILTNLGCGSRQQIGKVPPASENLRVLCHAYIEATDKMNRAPTNFEELLPFLKEKGDPDQLRRSPGDGEEYVIFWGMDYRSYGGAQPLPLPLLAFEKEGKHGKRWVFLLMNMMTELNHDEMQKVPLPQGQRLPF